MNLFGNDEDKEIIFYQERKFLNEDDKSLIASIVAEVKGETGHYGYLGDKDKEIKVKLRDKELIGWVVTTLIISDCSRTLTFEIDIDEGEKKFLNSMKKLDILIDTLKNFKLGCEVARERYLEDEKTIEAIKKEFEDSKKES